MKEYQKETIPEGKVIIEFYSDSCVPCKWLNPILEEFSKEYPEIDFYKVNVYNSNLPAKFMVRSVPTIVFLQDGVLKYLINGYRPEVKEEIKTAIKNYVI